MSKTHQRRGRGDIEGDGGEDEMKTNKRKTLMDFKVQIAKAKKEFAVKTIEMKRKLARARVEFFIGEK